MDNLSFLFIVALFLPGVVRGAFWHDAPSAIGVLWTFGTLASVFAAAWLTGLVFGNGLPPVIAMGVVLLLLNILAIRGALDR